MNVPTAVLPLATPPGKIASLPDFSERLSPMLVKELRQGMRSPIFVWGLIAMNLFLAGVVWLTMESPEEHSLHQAFFGGYCALVCGLLPLRAAGALHDELRGNTIDTLVLTRLTGWRITLGKWVAVVAQQMLATVTVLPYLIVRYFAGGIDIPMEFAWLGIFLMVGMGSAAILTGFSWIKYFLFRAAIMMGMTFLTLVFCLGVLAQMFSYRRQYLIDKMFQTGGWPLLLLLLVPALHMAFFSLDLGASKVGSIVENRSIRRRVVGLAVLLFYTGVGIYCASGGTVNSEGSLVLAIGLSVATFLLLGLQAVLEQPMNLVVVVMPFAKRGFFGKLGGRFFYPGWPSGLCYIFSVFTILCGASALYLLLNPDLKSSYFFDQFSTRDAVKLIVFAGATLGMLPIPLVLWQLFLRRRLPWHLGTYSLLLATVSALAIAITLLASTTRWEVLKLGLPIPAMGLAWLSRSSDSNYRYEGMDAAQFLDWDFTEIMFYTTLGIVIWWVLALWVALRAFRFTRIVEQEATTLLLAAKAQAAS